MGLQNYKFSDICQKYMGLQIGPGYKKDNFRRLGNGVYDYNMQKYRVSRWISK